MPNSARIALSISSRSNGAANELPTYRGFLLAMEKLFSDSPFDVEWVLFDDHGDPNQSRLLAETVAADERFVAVIGPMGSTEAFANAPVFSEARVLQISPCASHPDICARGYDTFYRLVPNERVQGGALATLAKVHLGASRVTIVHDTDAFGTTVSDNFTEAWEALGGDIGGRISLDHGDRDFDGLASAVKESSADVVFFAVHAVEGLKVSTAIRNADVTVPFLGTDGLKTSFFLGGGDPTHEAYHTHSGADFRRLSSAKDFRDIYVARFPEDSTYSPEAYDSVSIVADALAKAGEPSREAVLQSFKSISKFEGITGEISFEPNGERINSPVSWYRVIRTDGKRVMEYQGTVS